MNRAASIALVLFMSGCATIDPSPHRCEAEAIGNTHLSSWDELDAIHVWVDAAECHLATFELEVRTATDELVYRYAQPIGTLFWLTDPSLPAELRDPVAALVERTAATPTRPRRASTLPPYREGEFEYEPSDLSASLMFEVLTTREVYERIRSADQPVFLHAVGLEMTRMVAIDPKTGLGVAILDNWL